MIVPRHANLVHYPDSDGQPMADNPLQFEWITTIKWGCETLFLDRPDVFVAGDHLIYPIEGNNETQIAPDAYVAFGRSKAYRGSYKVWEEDGVFPQVVFEVWSPSNRQQQMEDKREAYDRYGVEEYYVVYPEFPAYVEGWVREGPKLARIADIKTWVSPRLGIRFEIHKGNLRIIRPDGKPFLNYVELSQEVDAERQRADEIAKQAAEMTAERDAERQRAERLAAKLRELGLDPDAG